MPRSFFDPESPHQKTIGDFQLLKMGLTDAASFPIALDYLEVRDVANPLLSNVHRRAP